MTVAVLSLTRQLADRVAATEFADLPPVQVKEAERAILDSISAAALGIYEPSSVVFRPLLDSAESDRGVSVIGSPVRRARTAQAVAYHAAISHQVEFAPAVSRAVLHVNGIVLAALAVAEETGAAGPELLRAVALGCEVAIRFGRALNTDPNWTAEGDHPVAFLKGWWMPAVGSTIGVATASVLLRGGNADQMHHAWGLAVNFTPATSIALVLEGSTGRGAAMSASTNSGLMAADLAMADATGPADIVAGWMAVMVDAFDPARLDGFPDAYEFNFLLYKPYATVGPCFAPIEAALAVREQYPDLDVTAIRDIEVVGYARTLRFFGSVPPPTAEAARGNVAYCVAAALAHNDPGEFIVDAFTEQAVSDPVVLGVSQKVRTTFSAEYESEYPQRSAKCRVLVTLTDGRVLEGFANRSAMPKYHDPSDAEIERKFNRVLAAVPAAAREHVLAAVRGLAAGGDPEAPLSLLSQAWGAVNAGQSPVAEGERV